MYSRIALASAAALALALFLAACGQKAPSGAEEVAKAEARSLSSAETSMLDELPPATGNEAIVPAIIPPAEVADPQEPPSYEVAIASAAALHNKALARCKLQPETVQAQCEQEANAAFTDAKANVQNLRGDKE